MIQVVHNSNESGDWVEVWNGDTCLHQNHTITPNDLVDILNSITKGMAVKINCNDEHLEEGTWRELV
jgi:hypothetical protein